MKTIKKLLLATLIAGGMVNQASASLNPFSLFRRTKKTVAQQDIAAGLKQNKKLRRKATITKLLSVLKNLFKKNLNPKTARGILVITLTLAAITYGVNYQTGGLIYATGKAAVNASGIINLIKYLSTACPDLGVTAFLTSALAKAKILAAPYLGKAAAYFTPVFTYVLAKGSQGVTYLSQLNNAYFPVAENLSSMTVAENLSSMTVAKNLSSMTQDIPCMPLV